MDKEKFIVEVAREYAAAPHEPNHPAYKAFCRETVAQFRGLVNSGWRFTRTANEPYSDSDAMFRDMRLHKHLAIFTGGKLTDDNPLNTYHLIVAPERKWWTANEMFRAVHDILGHGKYNSPFETFEGELAAYQEHKKWYSPEAMPALYSETVGQLCVYYATGDFVPVQENKILEVRL